MSWIPPGAVPEGARRALFLSGGIMSLFGSVWLLATTPFGRFTIMAILLAAAGTGLLWNWWTSR